MNGPRDFEATLRSWLQRAAPPEAPDRVLAAALARVADAPERRGWLASLSGGTRRHVLPHGAAVTAVIVLAILAGLRLSNLGPDVGGSSSPVPSGSAGAEASAPPPEATSVICEAFSDGGPTDNIAFGLPPSDSDIQLGLLSDGVNGLLALAERASGDERGDLLALATAVDDFTTDWGEATKYSPDEFRDLPQDAQDVLQNAAQDAWDTLQDAQHAFYRQYTERCGVAVDTPRTVDCGPLEQDACDRAVAGLIAGQRERWEEGFYDEGLPPGVPVLYVGFGGTRDCISHSEIRWPGGGLVAEILC